MKSLRLGQLTVAALLIAAGLTAAHAATPAARPLRANPAHGVPVPHHQRVDADSAASAPVRNLRLVKKPRIKSHIWA